jgi:hypothetical protein
MTIIGFLTGYHTVWKGEPYCPECGTVGKDNVTERGFDGHNHRHICKVCRTETRIANE